MTAAARTDPDQAPIGKSCLQVTMAASEGDVRAAQRLRWLVFSEELGARLSSPVPGLDIDKYDAHCEHLLVRDRETGEVVGTYRVLGPDAARRIGGYYMEQEFDLAPLQDLRQHMLELGRSCIHPDYRHGGVIALLWAGLAAYVTRKPHDFLIGCASIAVRDGGYNASGVWNAIRDRHISPEPWRVIPRRPLAIDAAADATTQALPPLLKGYLRAGAYVCGEPAWDPDFHAADVPMLLAIKNLKPAYARHFFRGC